MIMNGEYLMLMELMRRPTLKEKVKRNFIPVAFLLSWVSLLMVCIWAYMNGDEEVSALGAVILIVSLPNLIASFLMRD